MAKLKVYLSGPMTGYPEHNKPLFNTTAAELRWKGYDVVNPAESDDLALSDDWSAYLRKDLKLLAECDAIVLLPKWNRSKGARLEAYIAMSLGMPCFEPENMETYPLEIFKEPVFAAGGIAETVWR